MKNNIRQKVIAWNNRFPLDRWWRKKYSISYLSDDHRESTFYGQFFEYHEEKIFKEFFEKEDDKVVRDYTPLTGDWWIGKKSSKEEVNDWFNSPI